MATIQMVRIPEPLSEYSDNLLNYNSTFNNDLTFSIPSGSGLSECDDTHTFQGANSLKITNYLSTPMTVSTVSDLGFTVSQTGTYIFSLRLFYESSNGDDPSFLVNIFRNGVATNQYNCFYTEEFIPNNWLVFAQNIQFDAGDVITYSFDFNPAFINDKIWIDGLKCEINNTLGIPTAWTMPKTYCCSETGWQSKIDTVNTQVLTANTDNLIAFTGVDSQNGDLVLMNSVGKITPISVGDAIAVDFVFSFPSPAGTTDYLSTKLKVNGVVYRAQSFSILEPTGEINYISVSFNLPVEADFKTYGAELFINPNVAITISNRYLQVTRVHKAKI